MKKLSGPIIFTVLLFTIKSFGGSHLILPPGKKAPVKDTATANNSTDDNVRSYAIGLTYGTDQSFHGIHSNIKIPYLEPNFTYTAPSGFYFLVSFQDILVKDSGGFDALQLNPGWDIDLAENTTLNFNVSHYTFRPKTPLTIRSDLSNALETYIDQWVGETEGKFSVDYDYYKQTSKIKTPGDIVLTPDIAHTFQITLSDKASISLIPEGDIDFGTRNAYSHYQENEGDTVVNEKNKSGQNIKVRRTPDNSSFGTLDYTLTFTIDFQIGNLDIEPALNYNEGLYKVTGVPTSALTYGTLAFTYTIE